MLKYIFIFISLILGSCRANETETTEVNQSQYLHIKEQEALKNFKGKIYKDFDLFNLKGTDELNKNDSALHFLAIKEEKNQVTTLNYVYKFSRKEVQVFKRIGKNCYYSKSEFHEPEVETTTIDEKFLTNKRMLVFTSSIDHSNNNKKELYEVTELTPNEIKEYRIETKNNIKPTCYFQLSSIPKSKIQTIITWKIEEKNNKVLVTEKYKDFEGIIQRPDSIKTYKPEEFSYYWDIYFNTLRLF